jgi:heme O synthase-like polyprenyltransferase
MENDHSEIGNVAESSVIGIVVTFLVNSVLPWAIHTLAAILTGIIVAYCVFRYNKWMKKNDNESIHNKK